MKFDLVMTDDDIPTIMRGAETIGRALTKRDGAAIVDVLNSLSTDLRDQILSAVSDAIEGCFDGTES